MSEDDERLGARSFGDEPKIPVGFFVALIRYCTSPKTLASSMSEIVKISRRTSQVRTGREILRKRVPETDQKYVMIRTRVRSHGGWGGYQWCRAEITGSTSSSLLVLLKPTIPQKGLTVVWPETTSLTIRKDSIDLSFNANVWHILRDLKSMLKAKESIHVCYVKTGFHLKQCAMSLFSSDERVFNLYKEDLLSILSKDSFPRKILKHATLRAEMYLKFESPNEAGVTFIREERDEPTTLQSGVIGQTFVGVGVSSGLKGISLSQSLSKQSETTNLEKTTGKTTGIACVCKSLSDASRLQQGQILVVSHTGPSWTPVFSLVSAVVMDTGGQLSHGATVAREYGVPAVTVANATSIFKDGQALDVDGDEGIVTLISSSK